MAAAAVARRARLGAAMEAEVAAATTKYLLVRCAAAHPPSWHTGQGRAWIAPFAYGAQQATAAATTVVAAASAATTTAAATATGEQGPHRSTLLPPPYADELFGFAHISIVLLSFFPIMIYLALQWSSASDGAGAGCPPTSDDCLAQERAVPAVSRQALRETRLSWSELDSVEAASSSFGAVASANVFHPAGTGLMYSRAANKRVRPGEDEEKEQEKDEGVEPCSAWEVSCRLETLLAWWRSDDVGRETRVKAALRREVLPEGNKRWRNAESISGFTRALVAAVSANEATELGKDEQEGGYHGVWEFCTSITSPRGPTSPDTTGWQGGTQASKDDASEEGHLPRGWWLFTGGSARDDGGTTREAQRTVNLTPEGDVKNNHEEERRQEHDRTSGAS